MVGVLFKGAEEEHRVVGDFSFLWKIRGKNFITPFLDLPGWLNILCDLVHKILITDCGWFYGSRSWFYGSELS